MGHNRAKSSCLLMLPVVVTHKHGSEAPARLVLCRAQVQESKSPSKNPLALQVHMVLLVWITVLIWL